LTRQLCADPPSVRESARALRTGAVSSVELVTRCLDRIAAVDPLVRAVLALDGGALANAEAADRRRATGRALGLLDGIPVLVKDNIDTRGLASTAGSRLLVGAPPRVDAEIVSALRARGAIILGKANLSEWGNFRSTTGAEGWSAVGGQTRNPHLLDHSPWGSSAGSAVAVAAGMVPLAIGTETDGSIVCPAAVTGVVGVKPELGVLPGRGIVPISRVQDTPGLLTATVSDAADCLAELTGVPARGARSLAGQRIGVWQPRKMSAEVRQVVARVADDLTAVGARIVPITLVLDTDMLVDGLAALYAEFRPSIEAYLATRHGVPGSLPELIEANKQDPVELSLFGQDLFEQTVNLSTVDRSRAPAKRADSRRKARELIDTTMAEHGLVAILAPTSDPAWRIDYAHGDPYTRNTSTVAALAGRPNITVPAGFVGELPVGVSVFGPVRTEDALAVALAVEQAAGRRRPPEFRTSVN
jgi:amidase